MIASFTGTFPSSAIHFRSAFGAVEAWFLDTSRLDLAILAHMFFPFAITLFMPDSKSRLFDGLTSAAVATRLRAARRNDVAVIANKLLHVAFAFVRTLVDAFISLDHAFSSVVAGRGEARVFHLAEVSHPPACAAAREPAVAERNALRRPKARTVSASVAVLTRIAPVIRDALTNCSA